MLKIAAFIGSLRKESVNRMVFNHYQTLSQQTFEFFEMPVAELPLYNQDISPHPEIVRHASEQLKAADGILIFSPEYNYSIPGGLKNALDWFSRCENKPFDQKPASVIGASPGMIGTGRMQYHLRQTAVFLNLHMLNRPEVMIGGAYDKVKDGRILDAPTIDILKTHIEKFAAFIKRDSQ